MSSHEMTRIAHTNPASDAVFRADAELALRDRPLTAEELQARLHHRYPNVRVRYRALAGEADGFYLYRDGGWTRDARKGS